MLPGTMTLLREYGANATSIDRVLAHCGAPRGSFDHHFPGGRTQLIDEAVALAGDLMTGVIDAAMQLELKANYIRAATPTARPSPPREPSSTPVAAPQHPRARVLDEHGTLPRAAIA
jgi:AcrR family transcriptional regulator